MDVGLALMRGVHLGSIVAPSKSSKKSGGAAELVPAAPAVAAPPALPLAPAVFVPPAPAALTPPLAPPLPPGRRSR